MGIKISKVRDSKTLAEITTTDCENSHIGEYICPIENCHAQMSFVVSIITVLKQAEAGKRRCELLVISTERPPESWHRRYSNRLC